VPWRFVSGATAPDAGSMTLRTRSTISTAVTCKGFRYSLRSSCAGALRVEAADQLQTATGRIVSAAGTVSPVLLANSPPLTMGTSIATPSLLIPSGVMRRNDAGFHFASGDRVGIRNRHLPLQDAPLAHASSRPTAGASRQGGVGVETGHHGRCDAAEEFDQRYASATRQNFS
jgi:hypothetical protein